MRTDQIRYLTYEQISADKWDTCIAKSPNSLVYAQSWYLDKVCDRWDALVLGDYHYVMPIIFKKKLGITYLYQPLFCQQLGIFPTPTNELCKQFLTLAQERSPFAEINLNAMNLPVENKGMFEARKNYLLSLNQSYADLRGKYSTHTIRKLKKAQKHKLGLIHGISAEEFLKFKKQNLKTKITANDLNRLRNILTFSITRSMGQVYGVYSNQNNLCAAVFFLRYKNRVTYLNAATNDEGREQNAMYFLIDQFIKENAETDFMIDFEGSMIPGVARLYEGFGATPEKYHQVRWNRLPFWLRLLKK